MADLLPTNIPALQIEEPPRKVVRVEKNLTSMGFFTPSHKRLEKVLEKRVSIMVREDSGKRIEASATIVPSAKFGLPITSDQDKYYAFQKLLEDRRDRQGKISNPVAFSTNEMLKVLGMSRAGKNYEDIREWLSRMTFTGIESEGVIYLAGRRKFARDRFTVFQRVFSAGEILDNGQVADQNLVWLSDWQIDNLNERYVSLLNYDAYKQLKNHIAKHMVALIQNWFFAARHNLSLVIEKRYSELAQLLSITLYNQRSRIISSIGPSLDELMKFNLIASWSLEKTSNGKDWKITMTPGHALIARRRLAIQSGEMNDPHFLQLVNALQDRGVRDDFARKLLMDVSEDQPVLDQLEWADAQIAASPSTFKNPPGFYISVIRKNVAVPSTFETSSRRELKRKRKEATTSADDYEEVKRRELEMKYDEYRESIARKVYHTLSESERRKRRRDVEKELERDYPGVAWNELKVDNFIIRQFMNEVTVSFEDFCRDRQISLF